jgi:hypothetical protein
MSKLATVSATTLFVLFGVSTAFAQAALEEPGLYAFYHPDDPLSGSQLPPRSL